MGLMTEPHPMNVAGAAILELRNRDKLSPRGRQGAFLMNKLKYRR
jgi:hypothetical protein